MRLTRPSLLFVFVASLAVIACGDDGGSTQPDAQQQMDAMPGTLMGLGQKCVVAMAGADCPANAPGCLSFGGGAAMGICTPRCVNNGTMMTNAQSQIMTVTPDPFGPAQAGVCTAAFTGTVGTAACTNLIGGFMPPHNPLQANTQYTMVRFVCGIACAAGNTCPGGLTCTNNQCIP